MKDFFVNVPKSVKLKQRRHDRSEEVTFKLYKRLHLTVNSWYDAYMTFCSMSGYHASS